MTFPNLTEAWIRQQTTTEVFSRGKNYYADGAVLEVARRGSQITAYVEGSDYEPYQVTVSLSANGVTDAFCSCPYDSGGWCKHIVAVLLTLAHEPGAIEERTSVEALLQDLTVEQLRALLQRLLERHPELADEIEAQQLLLSAQSSALDSRAAPVRRWVQTVLAGRSGPYNDSLVWSDRAGPETADPELQRAWAFILAGDGKNALNALESVTQSHVNEPWDEYGEYGYDDEGIDFSEIGYLWIEALLIAELQADEKKSWKKKLKRWQTALDDYGYNDVFGAASEALRQGWDYPPLVRVLEGEITEQGAWEGEAPYYADDLAVARLNVLERQGRYTEYLYLAEAEGQMERYLVMLARLDRVEELLAYIQQYPCSLDAGYLVARALQEYGYPHEALQLAHDALDFGPSEYHKAQLAAWLTGLAVTLGQPELAAEASIAAFKAAPTLAAYQQALTLASEGWFELREQLLADLRARPATGSREIIEIFLHEALIDDAIEALGAYAYYDTVRLVVDAAIPTRPDWAIETCRKQAEPIMNEGKAKYYDHAAEWVAKARDAYRAAGREVEWRQYLAELLQTHGRKYKLVPLLQTLGKE